MSAKRRVLTDDMARGLVLRPEFATKFFDRDSEGQRKTLELRNCNLRCVEPEGRFFIVACQQGKNKHGQKVVKILGSVAFVENLHIPHDQIPKLFDQHLCPREDYNKLSSKWAKDHCCAWRVKEALALPQPMWVNVNNQDRDT